jgi:hypothetical protein
VNQFRIHRIPPGRRDPAINELHEEQLLGSDEAHEIAGANHRLTANLGNQSSLAALVNIVVVAIIAAEEIKL